MDSYQIILMPIATEAVFDLIEDQNQLVFYVHPKAGKYQIKKAFNDLFEVMYQGEIYKNQSQTPVSS